MPQTTVRYWFNQIRHPIKIQDTSGPFALAVLLGSRNTLTQEVQVFQVLTATRVLDLAQTQCLQGQWPFGPNAAAPNKAVLGTGEKHPDAPKKSPTIFFLPVRNPI